VPVKEESPVKAEEAAPLLHEDKKWLDIALQESEIRIIRDELTKGLHMYGITVYVKESCILKAARAFLVFKSLGEHGDIVVSSPSIQDIEDERFDREFSIYFATKETLEAVTAVIMRVSEIERAVGEAIELNNPKLILTEEDKEEQKAGQTAKAEANNNIQPSPVQSSSQNTGSKKAQPAKPVVNRTVRVDIEKLDVLMNLVSELIIAKNSLVAYSACDDTNGNFNEQVEYLESVTTNLHESVMKVRMVPIESVVNKFPRMIRDLSKSLGKKMELYMSGEETELDRTVVDEIGDPLMHLLRNSADHGLESNDVRKARGKEETGSIFLDAYQDGNNVVIEVRDDGNGIDVEAVRNKAIERGTITPDQAVEMSDKEIVDLLFLPSFSTAKVVSDVSGRGVGLDVVKSKIGALGGDVSVKTKLGSGSTWTIRLPLTLAIIQALMVVVGGEKYAIALGSIQTIEDIAEDEVKYVETNEVISLRGSVIPLIRLHTILDVESTKDPSESMVVVIVKKGDALAGFVVDELIGQQEIVIKSLGRYINPTSRMISGATILGDGEVALILDVNVLI
ncbi:MAG: chemotaxis protein CheA, partial [Lachnospiraceae bacterium]